MMRHLHAIQQYLADWYYTRALQFSQLNSYLVNDLPDDDSTRAKLF